MRYPQAAAWPVTDWERRSTLALEQALTDVEARELCTWPSELVDPRRLIGFLVRVRRTVDGAAPVGDPATGLPGFEPRLSERRALGMRLPKKSPLVLLS